MERKIWKIKLMPNGTWVNVYDDEIESTKRSLQSKLQEFNELQELRDELIDLAMQAKGMSEAHDLINRIRYDGPRDPISV
jgi:hypothetical protein